ncbi:MAG: glycerophosphodiester phosphodiesterase family protein [Candidatus Latescibacterota bacterium]|jgi:glycerophosphoryl diester phosphodiesterase
MIPPVRIAHRGASGEGLAPENTLAAFERAIETGVDAVELDVRATRDGHLVVLHDAELDRTTDATGPVRELTLDQVRQADAGSWRGEEYRGQRVPTLAEVLELCRRRVLVLIEIKADGIAERTLQVIDDLGAREQVVVQSFTPEIVRRVKVLQPGIPAALLVGRLPTAPSRLRARRLVTQVLEVGANALAIWHATLTPALIEEVRKRAVSLWTWTVDEEIVMRDMVLLGVQGIITNHPDRLNQVLDDLILDGRLYPPVGRQRRVRKNRWGRRRQLRKLSGSGAR